MINQLKTAALFIFLLQLSIKTIYCFHDLPHMIILGIAKKTIIQTEPEIVQIAEKYFNQFEEAHLKGQVTFEEHSLWSDDIKDHYKGSVDYWGHWHYIDQIYNPYNVEVTPDCMDEHLNALTAFKKIQDIFKNDKFYGKITVIKHIYLKHLVHLIGDIHQPLHTMSLFNEKFPKGDIGGNKQKIQVGNRKGNLHFYFDSAAFFYNFKDRIHRPLNDTFIQYFDTEIENLIKQYPITLFGIKQNDIDINQWVAESFEISKKEIYSQIDLTNKINVNIISEENHQKNIELSKRQIVKAGYRLANVLINFLKEERGLYSFDDDNNVSDKSNLSSRERNLIVFIVLQTIIFIAIIAIISYRFKKVKKQLWSNNSHNIEISKNINLEHQKFTDDV